MDSLKRPSLEKEIRGIRVGLIRNNPIIAKGKRSESNEELVSWRRRKTPWSKVRVDLTGLALKVVRNDTRATRKH